MEQALQGLIELSERIEKEILEVQKLIKDENTNTRFFADKEGELLHLV